ncbi:MAG: hypothetical protein WBH22_14560 [Pseudomonas mandelii]|uniref:hypothetical protein n=1 Tax=Pseudomonas mandelii TaxID=75612 RepID=UPI00398D5930
MSNSKKHLIGLALALLSGSAAAELPHSSILSRYGMTPDQLPTPAPSEPADPQVEKSRFQLQPEEPFVTFRSGEKQPEMTGNISIDHAMQQDYERCQKIHEELRRRGGKFISCDNSTPWMP